MGKLGVEILSRTSAAALSREAGESEMIDKERLSQILADPSLQIFTVVVLGAKDLADGRFDSAMARLRVDADKFVLSHCELYNMIMQDFKERQEKTCQSCGLLYEGE